MKKKNKDMRQELYPASKEIIEFVVEAISYGWPENTVPREDKEFPEFFNTKYIRNDWRYLDLWSGATTDVGIQLVFFEEVPIWSCMYRGGIINSEYAKSETIESNLVFKFLIEALQREKENILPIRGPRRYESEDNSWNYQFNPIGSIDSFYALEDIYHKHKHVYQRILIGGRMGDGIFYGDAISDLRQSHS